MDIDNTLISIKDFSLTFNLDNEKLIAIDNVSFDIAKNSIIGIVGESGSGKSSLGLSILSLHQNDKVDYDGSIIFENKNILEFTNKELQHFRGKDVSMIFQEPMNALNPVMKIGKQIAEPLITHNICSESESKKLVIDMLNKVGMENAKERIHSYPHELSGGMRQRVMIAMSIITNPKLLIADEPTTSLDITISRQILSLIKNAHNEYGISVMFISHDLSVIEAIADRVIVMYLGKVLENSKKEDIVKNPLHPYTKSLFAIAHSIREKDNNSLLPVIGGEVPSALNKPKGCAFHPRCSECMPICKESLPKERIVGTSKVSCHLYN